MAPLFRFLKSFLIYRLKRPDLHKRVSFIRKIKTLSQYIQDHSLAAIYISDNGDPYLVMPDGLKVFYNTHFNQKTLADGQSLDLHGSQNTYYEAEKLIEGVLFSFLQDGQGYFDIGANNGYFYALKAAHRLDNMDIHCFEPDTNILPHLHRNIAANSLQSPIKVIESGVADKTGTFYLRKNMGASGFIEETPSAGIEQYDTIQTVSLDDYVKKEKVQNTHFIKVDIEGGEYNFLKGAEKTIKSHKPILLMELRPKFLERSGSSMAKVQEFFKKLQYEMYKINLNEDYFLVPAGHEHTDKFNQEFISKVEI